MSRICEKCNGIVNYDPYFKAFICNRCGNMQRVQRDTVSELNYPKKYTKTKISYYAKPSSPYHRRSNARNITEGIHYEHQVLQVASLANEHSGCVAVKRGQNNANRQQKYLK